MSEWGFWIFIITILGSAAAFFRWQGKVDEKLKGIDDLNKTIVGMKAQFEKNFNEIFLRLPTPKTYSSQSPPRLTDFGKKISKELDMKHWLDAHQSKIGQDLKDKEELKSLKDDWLMSSTWKTTITVSNEP